MLTLGKFGGFLDIPRYGANDRARFLRFAHHPARPVVLSLARDAVVHSARPTDVCDVVPFRWLPLYSFTFLFYPNNVLCDAGLT